MTLEEGFIMSELEEAKSEIEQLKIEAELLVAGYPTRWGAGMTPEVLLQRAALLQADLDAARYPEEDWVEKHNEPKEYLDPVNVEEKAMPAAEADKLHADNLAAFYDGNPPFTVISVGALSPAVEPEAAPVVADPTPAPEEPLVAPAEPTKTEE